MNNCCFNVNIANLNESLTLRVFPTWCGYSSSIIDMWYLLHGPNIWAIIGELGRIFFVGIVLSLLLFIFISWLWKEHVYEATSLSWSLKLTWPMCVSNTLISFHIIKFITLFLPAWTQFFFRSVSNFIIMDFFLGLCICLHSSFHSQSRYPDFLLLDPTWSFLLRKKESLWTVQSRMDSQTCSYFNSWI